MSKLHSSGEMLRIAGEVAEMLLDDLPTVAQVGLIGSLARQEKNPGDIDLVVLTTDRELTEGLLKAAEGARARSRLYPSDWLETVWNFGASDELCDQVKATLGGEHLHIVVLPTPLTDEHLTRFAAVNLDPLFLEHAAADFQRYDPKLGQFASARAPWQDYLDRVSEQAAVRQYPRHYPQAEADAWTEKQWEKHWEEMRQEMREELRSQMELEVEMEPPLSSCPEPPDAASTPLP